MGNRAGVDPTPKLDRVDGDPPKTWDFVCPTCGFRSTRHVSAADANDVAADHSAEHDAEEG